MTGQTWPALVIDETREVRLVGASLLPPGRYGVTAQDWCGIFKRYAEIVGREEGVDFLCRDEWSEEEWAAFHRLWPDETRFASE